MEQQLRTYTVYEHPLDHPDGYSMTTWEILPGDAVPVATVYAATLEQVRMLIPDGLTRLGRDPNDDPAILETWI